MHIGNIKYFSTVNGEGVRTAVFVTGCRLHCKGCFNKELWDFNVGKEMTDDIIEKILKSIEPEYIEGLSILGGEPMDEKNQEGVAQLVEAFKKKFSGTRKTIWLWTGYNIKNIPFTAYSEYILENVDTIVDGPFILEERDTSLAFRGSRNQNIIKKVRK